MVNYVSKNAILGKDVDIGHFSVVNRGVNLGEGVQIGNNVTIYPGTVIEKGVIVGDGAVIGKPLTAAVTSTVSRSKRLKPVLIKENSIIGALSVVYAGVEIGSNSLVGDQAFIREECVIGDLVIIGRGVCLENEVQIADRVKIQSGAYITAYTKVEQKAFIAPMVTTANDNFMGRTEERFKYIKGPNIGRGARVGAGSIILPGVNIGEETFVAAGAVVTRDTIPGSLVKGLPAKKDRDVPREQLLPGKDGREQV